MRTARAAILLVSVLALAWPAGPVHAQAAPGDGIQVAVFDTGVDGMYQSELAGRVDRMSFYRPTVPPVPGLPDPTQLQPDPDGHGTAVASVVAGKTLGVAAGARIMDLQVSAQYTRGTLDPTTEEAASRAMDWMLQHHGGNGSAGPRVALLSFADNLTPEGASTLAAQAQQLWSQGVLVVVPLGGNTPLHTSPYVLTIGDQDATCDTPQVPSAAVLKPDLSAAARNVKVATPGSAAQAGGTGQASGTPLASAAVAGAAARLWQARPDLPVAALQSILRDTASDRAAKGPDTCTGFGSLAVDPAITAAQAWSDPVPADALPKASPAPAAALIGLTLVVAAGIRRRR